MRVYPERVGPSLRVFWSLVRGAAIATYRDRGFSIAKGAAYSALLSFFPLLATVGAVLVQTRAEFVLRAFEGFLSQVVPPGTEDLVFYYLAVTGSQPVLLPVSGIVVSLLAASGVMLSLFEGFRAAYHIPAGRTFIGERVVALLLVFSAAIPAVAGSVLVLFGRRIERWIGTWISLTPKGAELEGWVAIAGTALRYLIALGAVVLGTSILYYFGPNRRQRWRQVWPGAVLATLLWFLATSLFGWYTRNIANYNVMYGGIAAVIALLVWMYLLALIAIVGCEFNAAWERLRRPGAEPVDPC